MFNSDKILELIESSPRLHRLILKPWAFLPVSFRVRVLRMVSPSMTLGGVAVITADSASPRGPKVLLGFHAYHWRQGAPWALLGGAVKMRDTDAFRSSVFDVPARAVVREVKEETDLDIDINRLIAVDTDWGRRTIDFFFECSLREHCCNFKNQKLNPEIRELRWFHLSNLPDDLFPQHRRFLTIVWPAAETLPTVPWSAA